MIIGRSDERETPCYPPAALTHAAVVLRARSRKPSWPRSCNRTAQAGHMIALARSSIFLQNALEPNGPSTRGWPPPTDAQAPLCLTNHLGAQTGPWVGASLFTVNAEIGQSARAHCSPLPSTTSCAAATPSRSRLAILSAAVELAHALSGFNRRQGGPAAGFIRRTFGPNW